jgi:hypothetical protein
MIDRRLRVLAVLALGLFWVPLVGPFVQAVTAAEAARAAWTGRARRASVALAGAGAGAGFGLFLATQWLWIV